MDELHKEPSDGSEFRVSGKESSFGGFGFTGEGFRVQGSGVWACLESRIP